MSIESATSSVSTASQSTQVSAPAAANESTKKSASDTSFKDEMNKVSSNESSKDSTEPKTDNTSEDLLSDNTDFSKFGSLAVNDANAMLSNDIMQMMYNNSIYTQNIYNIDDGMSSPLNDTDKNNQVSLTQSDAQFFINLIQTDDVSAQNVAARAQALLNQGADVQEVAQNVKISQTLLNAINTAKETNQPIRIDFDTNISVVLRIGKDNVISANFIPGDKVVEQYLRNNMETLKATFRENELPYSDLSYSNSSKRENEKRRNKQQGE